MRRFATIACSSLAIGVAGCGAPDADDAAAGGGGDWNAQAGASPWAPGTGGASMGGASAGGASMGGSAPGVTDAGGTTTGGAESGDVDVGGSAGTGAVATGGTETGGTSTGGTETGGTSAGGTNTGGAGAAFTLDCGPNGWAVEAHGPPQNRVNYAIVGDGYLAADLVPGGTFEQHIDKAMAKRFSVPIGEPYGRYRKFVNICAIKLVSTRGICDGSPLGCCGDDSSRLASCDRTAADQAFAENLPADFVIDWKAVVLNGDHWWNTGSSLMLWSGGHPDADGAALHEGGHGFHQLADEYTGSGSGCTTEYAEVNSTADPTRTAGKWDLWLDYDQAGATGLQTTIAGSRYCTAGQYRPSSNSMMNMLFGDNPNTSYNSVSREQIIYTIWRAVVPIDSVRPPAGEVSNASSLSVQVIDPEVIDVDWSIDGTVVAARGGEVFDLAGRNLRPGAHTISARAYDNASDDWVRYRTGTCPDAVTGRYCARTAWPRSQQTVTWTVTVQ